MAYVNTANILDSVQSRVNDQSANTRARLLQWLNDAMRTTYAERTWNLLQKSVDLAIVLGVITFPADIYRLISIEVGDTVYKPTEALSYRENLDDTLTIDPIPTATTALMVYFPAMPDTDYTDSASDTIFPLEFKTLFQRATLSAFYEFDVEQQAMGSYQLDQAELARLKKVDNKRKVHAAYQHTWVHPRGTDLMAWQIARFQDFTGGENRVASLNLIKPNQVFLGLNSMLSADGSLETRKGRVKINTTSLGSGPVLSVFRWATEAGKKYLTVQHGTSLYNVEWDGTSAVETFGTAVKGSLTASKKLRGVVWLNKLHLCNGTQNNFSFDGATTCTDHPGTPPKSTIMVCYAGRLWINDVALPNLIRFSNLESYSTWDVLDVLKVRDGDGDIITGIAAQPGGMVVFKNTSMWTVYGTSIDSLRLELLSDYIGCISPDSILSDGFFVGPDNLYGFTLSSVTPFPPTHKSYLDDMTATEKALISAAYLPFDQLVIVSLSTDIHLCIDPRTGAIFTWSGLHPQCMTMAKVAGDDGSLIVGDATLGHVYVMNGLQDDAGERIITDVRLAYNDMQTAQDKVFRAIRPTIEILYPRSGSPNNVNILYDVDKINTEYSQTTPTYRDPLQWSIDHWGAKVWDGQFLYDTNQELLFFSARQVHDAPCNIGHQDKDQIF